MAKKIRNDIWSLPPEGLWISPTGQKQNVNEHLLAIKDSPEEFGLSPQQVAGLDMDAIRGLAEEMIGSGWTRYRYLDGVYHFEVDDAKRRTSIIDDVLIQSRALPQEQLVITQHGNAKTFEGTVGDFFDRVFFRFAKKKVKADAWAWKKIG
jgi:hypothetical protein